MGQKSIVLAVALIIFTVILGIFLVVSRMRGDSSQQKPKEEETTETTTTRNVVEVADIIREPEVYDGYTLEVDSEITSWATNRSFFFTATLGGGLGGGQRRSLLVIGPRPFQLPQESDDEQLGLGERARVSTKGIVQIMNKDQLESALGIDLEDPKQTLYDNSIKKWSLGPVLVISDVKIDNTVRD